MICSKTTRTLRSLKRLLPLILLVLGVLTATAQQEPNKKSDTKTKLSLSVQPLFLLNNALKVDAEIHPNGKQFGVIGGVEVYDGETEALYSYANRFGEKTTGNISGFGINLAAVYQFSKQSPKGSFYVSPGITYRKLDLELSGPMFYSYTENNVEYITYGVSEQTYQLKPILFYGNFGYQLVAGSFLLDVYSGIGYKSVKKPTILLTDNVYEKGAHAYAYNGFLFLAGVKLGYQF